MANSVRMILAIGFGALAGCAQTQPVRTSATDPVPTTTASQSVQAPLSSAAVPEVDGKPAVNANTKDKFEVIAAAVRQQMQPGGRWQFVDKKEREMIDDSFADMGKVFGQFGSVDKMDDSTKVRLLADQSTVNAILTKKDGDRLICKNVIPVGSHLPVKTCRTYSQIQLEERGTQDSLQKIKATRQQMHCGMQQNGSVIAC